MQRARSSSAQTGLARRADCTLTVLLALSIGARVGAAAEEFPPSGLDAPDAVLELQLETSAQPSPLQIRLEGSTVLQHGDPYDPGDGRRTIDTEIVDLDVLGTDPSIGPIRIVANPDRSSRGRVRAEAPGSDYPADCLFEVHVAVELGGRTVEQGTHLVNRSPVRFLATGVRAWPPFFKTFEHPPPAVDLVAADEPNGPVIARILEGTRYRAVQDPSYSLDAGGPSGLLPGDLRGAGEPPPLLPGGSLLLGPADDVSALSYGVDIIDLPGVTSVAFSVDPTAAGAPGSAVSREVTVGSGTPLAPPEASGDEFIAWFNGTNQLLVDEQDLLLRTGSPGDDIDALVNQPLSFVAFDDANSPFLFRDIFFSLAPSSPTLGLPLSNARPGPADTPSPDDILVFSAANSAIELYASGTHDIGLRAGDAIDALCLMSVLPFPIFLQPGSGAGAMPPRAPGVTDRALFSLARGSPTLASGGFSAADLLITDFSGSFELYAPASSLGLLATDDLNALGCLTPASSIIVGGTSQEEGTALLNVGGENFFEIDPSDPNGLPDPSFYPAYMLVNPGMDAHGPYWRPAAAPPAAGLSLLDPFSLAWTAPDLCPYAHVEGELEGHPDPDPARCGHGYFKPISLFATEPIGSGVGHRPVAEALATLIDREAGFLTGASATARRTNNPNLEVEEPARTLGSLSPAADSERSLVIVRGSGPTKLTLRVAGAEGLELLTPSPLPALPLVVEDGDGDGVPDHEDRCPTVANAAHAAPTDCNGDGDEDDPGEGIGEQCDIDADRVGDACDNCRRTPNPGHFIAPEGHRTTGGQTDDDLDGIGNHCDADFTEGNGDSFVNVTDLLRFLDAFGKPIRGEDCPDRNGIPAGSCARYDLNVEGKFVNVSDLLIMISSSLFGSSTTNQACGADDLGIVRCPLECQPGAAAPPCPAP